MATLLLFIKLLVYSSLLLALEGRNSMKESHFHTLEITSLLPDSVCTPSTGSVKRQSTLEVFHRHGPCSKLTQEKPVGTPSPSELLSYDQSRVQSIQARLNRSRKSRFTDGQKVDLPAQPGRSLGTGNYLVTLALGTPKKTLSLVFDTGSDLSWTQCQPCLESCYDQQDPIFDPSSSSSYSNISCSSSQCSQLPSATGQNSRCDAGMCGYRIKYGDGSFTEGFLSKDTLSITDSDVFPDFLFGCGQNNQGLFGEIAGLVGLGSDPLSLVSQTAAKYGKYFSYCLPSTSSSTGHLTLGQSGASSGVKFTPFDRSRRSSFYFITITSITVGGTQLPISQSVFQTAGTIIDSGTVITRLPPSAYSALRTDFKQKMAKYPSAPGYSLFDTCFDLSNYTTVEIPIVTFTFGGDVEVDLPPSGILRVADLKQVCLAFAGNNEADNVGIFGNTQQKTFEVVYDVAGGQLGFGAAGCN